MNKAYHRELQQSFHTYYEALVCQLNQPMVAQFNKLDSILKNNSHTTFGKEYGFSDIKTIDQFQSQVPLTTYDDISEAIEKQATRGTAELTSSPYLYMLQTSGSTSARKNIPYTKELLEDFRLGICPWLYDLYVNFPHISSGEWYWSLSPPERDVSEKIGLIPIGTDNDLAYFTQNQQALLGKILISSSVHHGMDIDSFFLQTAKALQDREISFVSIWSPTFLERIASKSSLSNALEGSLISSWGDAQSKVYFERLQKKYSNSFFQKKGILSTEGCYAVPLSQCEGYVPAITSHFFEFINEQGRVHTIGNLDNNSIFELVITTSGGLYRYKTGDLIRTVNTHHQTPTYQFIGRNKTSDLVGEKLCEQDAIRIQVELGRDFFGIAPSSQDQRYTIFHTSTLDDETKKRIAHVLSKNPYLQEALDRGQLKPFLWKRVDFNNAEAIQINHYRRNNVLVGDVKPPLLLSESLGVELYSSLK